MGQGGEVRGHKAGVTDDGHSLNCVRRKCRLIERRDRYHRLEFASAFGAVQTCAAGSLATDCLMLGYARAAARRQRLTHGRHTNPTWRLRGQDESNSEPSAVIAVSLSGANTLTAPRSS